MGTYFSIFDSTAANLAVDLRTAILNSADWSQPNAAGLPNLVKATTTGGAQMVVQLDDAAVTSKQMQLGVYRQHDGTTGVDKIVRYLVWRNSVTGTTTDPLHVTVSAGKDHLYFSVEGPYSGEANPESITVGSMRGAFFLGAISPYFAADTVPAVCCVGVEVSSSTTSLLASVSRNQANNASWVPARLLSLQVPSGSVTNNSSDSRVNAVQRSASDGATYLWPYVVVENVAGLRGRLTKCHFAGFNIDGVDSVADPVPAVFSRLSYGGDTYTLVAPTKPASAAGSYAYLAFGHTGDVVNSASPIIAVPSS